jgi:membrane protease YdiL (CAAX protease family)
MPIEVGAGAIPDDRQPIASSAHTLGLVLINVGIAVWGIVAQMRSTGGAGLAAEHSGVVPLYSSLILMEWALLYYVWAGTRKNVSFWGLVGGRWSSLRDVLTDFGIALPFWVIWETTAWLVSLALGPNAAKTVDVLLPRGLIEVALWIALSASAGFCEEIVYRGYLQRQLRALSGSRVLAVIGQALVFGVGHAYQGWKNVVVIAVLGVLYGLLVLWRKNLRSSMLAHAWSDIWGGYVKFLLPAHF